MPKLNKEQAKGVAETEGGNFDPIESGVYHARLREVENKGPGPSGSDYWAWQFELLDEPYVNRRLWTNTSLSEAAAFKLKEVFEAFGVDTDTDTDELCGQIVKLVVSTRVIQEGSKKGETANQIERVQPKADDYSAPNEDAVEADLF